MKAAVAKVLNHCIDEFPNLKIAYLTSDGLRHFSGLEPHAWQMGFTVKWLTESQINGEPGTAFEGENRTIPWLAWGPYIWDNTWDVSYFTDRVHVSPKEREIFVERFWHLLSTDSVARAWFLRYPEKRD